jgi:hypothetical protein
MTNTPPLAPLPRDQRRIDADHLTLLAIFHFVGAGLALLGILFLFGHFMMMHAVFMNPAIWENQKQGPPPAEFLSIFIWFYIVAGIWFFLSLILNVLSGVFLLNRRCRMFSLVVGAVNCLHVPLGTVLGVFTIVVLVRESVRELYEAERYGRAI